MFKHSNGQKITEQRQFLLDVMVTAFEGGCNYWAIARNVKRDQELNYLSFDVRDAEDSTAEWKTITPEKIGEAITKIQTGAVKVGKHIALQFTCYPGNVDHCDVDADGADVAVQVAAFGEIVFG